MKNYLVFKDRNTNETFIKEIELDDSIDIEEIELIGKTDDKFEAGLIADGFYITLDKYFK